MDEIRSRKARGLAALLLCIILAGCAKQTKVQTPTGAKVQTQDRIAMILQSDLPAEKKVELVRDVLHREESRGGNWKEVVLAVLTATLSVIGVVKR